MKSLSMYQMYQMYLFGGLAGGLKKFFSDGAACEREKGSSMYIEAFSAVFGQFFGGFSVSYSILDVPNVYG